ncbi:MAG: hypothetical protein CSA76_06170 [Spirochaetales bacterium]|nr:MAG: hypothetical protein CSA76_06170 [Spirochaetales bacterium]
MNTAVNPFTGQTTSTVTSIPVPAFLRHWGFRLQEIMLDAARSIRDADGIHLGPVLLAFGIAMLFGMVHIIGPGHGKLFTIGYFGSRRAKLKEGLWLSVLVNLLDSISAFLLVSIVYGVLSLSLRSTGGAVERTARLIAYGSVAVLGIVHLAGHLKGGHSHHHGHDHEGHIHNGHSQHHHTKQENSGLKPWMLAVSIGIIPCPVSSAILAWGIVNKALGFTVLLVLGVSAGGTIAMAAFSLALISGKSGLTRLLERKGFTKALEVFEFLSMGLIIAAGILLFISAL